MKYIITFLLFCFGVISGMYGINTYNTYYLKRANDIVYINKEIDYKKQTEVYISSDKKAFIIFRARVENGKVLKQSIEKSIYFVEPMSSLNVTKTYDWYKFQLDQGHLNQIAREIIK